MQYVTYDNLIQFSILIVALIGLVYKICHKGIKTNRPEPEKHGRFIFLFADTIQKNLS